MEGEYTIIPITKDYFRVYKKKESDYFVDLAKKECECKGFAKHKHCKHLEMCKGVKNG